MPDVRRRAAGPARAGAVGPLLLTPGDILGVGPEVTCRALAERRAAGRPADVVLVGDLEALRPWAERWDLPLAPRAVIERVAGAVPVVDPGDEGEPVEAAAVRLAVHAIQTGRGAALVTGPIHKARLARRGFRWAGHTDFLGHLCGVERPVMAFVGGSVRVALVTVHVPLRRVAELLTTDGVLHTVRLAHRALRDQLGLARPRLVVCGLNPHAGDQGLLGDEDASVVAPAVARAEQEGIEVTGPVSAEAAFRAAVRGEVDLVVATYHDQGLAPLKALEAARVVSGDIGEERAVNWTLGLPIVRTSVDHGTADDIAGRGVADPGSMAAAIALAERLVRA